MQLDWFQVLLSNQHSDEQQREGIGGWRTDVAVRNVHLRPNGHVGKKGTAEQM
jgi:hypothetical protein